MNNNNKVRGLYKKYSAILGAREETIKEESRVSIYKGLIEIWQ